MGWGEYALAFAAFFLTHSVPIRPPVRPWLVARLGSAGFGIAYSALSLGVLAWLIGAAGRAPYVPLWHWSPWQNHVVLTAMLPVCLILALAIARPNPFSFGGARNERFDPVRPGIVRLTRHPLLFALAFWAGAHLLANGDLAHAILFGIFALFAGLGGRLVDRRKRRDMGPEWQRIDSARRQAPFLPRPASWAGAAIRLALGVGLYAALVWMHPYLFGVSPLP
ncbi:NnrU family protein [Rhodosalinus sp. K401]|uniref:NnrU family protein n=1 Tax=Rhodosalinus sp. K401 TaxID=3239195 RepID=UPI00352416C6